MRKTYIAICATAALGLCLMAPKGASAPPAADGAGKAISAVAGKSAVTQVRFAGRVGGIGRVGIGRAGLGYRGFGLGVGRFGLRGAAFRHGFHGRRVFFRRRFFAPGVGLGLGLGWGAGWGWPGWGWGTG